MVIEGTTGAVEQLDALHDAVAELLAGDWQTPAIRLTIQPAIAFNDPAVRFALVVERERTTASGRAGKPTRLLSLVNSLGEGPAQLLDKLARLMRMAPTTEDET